MKQKCKGEILIPFRLVWFYGIATIVVYFMPEHSYAYILNNLYTHFVDYIFE